MKKKAFVSALGRMGRNHARGLAKCGYDLVTIEPDISNIDLFRSELKDSNLDCMVDFVDRPSSHYAAAIFSETVPSRLTNLKNFIKFAKADKFLIEKPITSDPLELDEFLKLSISEGLDISVNFSRRAWPHIRTLAKLCHEETSFVVMINGGAVGLGCNGIHFLDMFLDLCGEDVPEIESVSLSDRLIDSGRGKRFKDIGGDFTLRGRRGALYASLSSESSAGVFVTIRGSRFIAYLDYINWSWKLVQRDPSSELPTYRYGAEYRVIDEGHALVPNPSEITERWARGSLQLPSLDRALVAHNLLFDILARGGMNPPYRFT